MCFHPCTIKQVYMDTMENRENGGVFCFYFGKKNRLQIYKYREERGKGNKVSPNQKYCNSSDNLGSLKR